MRTDRAHRWLARAAGGVVPEHMELRLAAGEGTAWQYAWRTAAMLGLLLIASVAAWRMEARRTP